MADLTRRGFLTRTSLTVGAVGVGLAGGMGLRQLAAQGATPSAATNALPSVSGIAPVATTLAGVSLPSSMIVHVRDVPSGEISVMFGTNEVVYRDQEVVARLLRAAGPAAAAEG